MSTDRQEASIPTQREALQKLAAKLGYAIVGEYVDEGISGDDTERRTAFRKMLADASAGGFDCVLCWDQSRFGRFDPLEAGYWIKPLRDVGVWLETVAEGRIDWSDFAGRIVYAVQQEGKHAFLKDMSRAVARGMLAKAKRGEWLGGKAPYGYVLNAAKRLEPGDAEAVETVRWIFHEYLTSDVSCAGLADQLNARGVPPPEPGTSKRDAPRLWGATAVYKILTRPAYLGHSVWNRKAEGAYHGIRGGEIVVATKPKRKVVANDPAEWIVIEDTHEALVDRPTFDRVAKKLASRRDSTTPHRGGGDFLFTGLLRCGHCGWPMHGAHLNYIQGGKRRKYRRYICGKYNLHRKAGCTCNTVLETELLDVVVRIIQREFLKPENLSALKAEIRRQEEAERAGREKPAAALDRRIAALERDVDAGTDKWLKAPPSLTAVLGAKLEQWRADLERLRAERRELAKPAASAGDLDAAVETITAGLATLRQSAGKASPALVRDVLRNIVDRVELWFRQVPYGQTRQKSMIERGTIHLRDELVVCRPIALAKPDTTQ
jgi:DNA invertase Pin-like site-specific DNA recombinase